LTNNATVYDEKDVLAGLAAGDQGALTAIYNRHWKPLFTSANNILKDKQACEDILHDIFLNLWVKRETLNIQESLQAYLYMATRYQVFRYINNNASIREDLFENLEERFLTTPADHILHQKEITGIIKEVVDALPDKCRTIYKMSREQQLSHKEIAEQLNITTKTVENQLTIALRKLRTALGDLLFLMLFL
jgi:RNA polymerase sigma-19 factor, ECF subfamily